MNSTLDRIQEPTDSGLHHALALGSSGLLEVLRVGRLVRKANDVLRFNGTPGSKASHVRALEVSFVDGEAPAPGFDPVDGLILATMATPTSASNLEWFVKTFMTAERQQAAARGQSVYAGTKGYMESFTRALAAEYSPRARRGKSPRTCYRRNRAHRQAAAVLPPPSSPPNR